MKIRLLSDLHCEGYKYYYEYAGEDVIVLAGDIHTKNRHRFVLDQIPQNVRIVFVAGNHEYYDNTFERVNDFFYELQDEYNNFSFLNNNNVVIDGVNFFGGTMFTDFSLYGDAWTARQFASKGISDFYWIDKVGKSGDVRKWNVQDHVDQHELFTAALRKWIADTTAVDEKRVVVTHFVPSPKCISQRFAGSSLNPYFTVDMEQYMGWEGHWLFGHTHDSFVKQVGSTNLVNNPRGYGNENKFGFNGNLVLDI